VNELIGQLKISDCVKIHPVFEITIIMIEGDIAMMMIEHGGHSIETKAVKTEFLEPVSEIGKEKSQDLWPTIIKQAGIPLRMFVLVEVEPFLSIKCRESLGDILDRMGMDNIHQDSKSMAVSLINQVHEILWSAAARAWSKEIGHMVTKRPVIGVLRNGHELDHIVTEARDPREHLISKLTISSHSMLLGGHANVRFVNPGSLNFRGRLILPTIAF
jgi:hypothetical protein